MHENILIQALNNNLKALTQIKFNYTISTTFEDSSSFY